MSCSESCGPKPTCMMYMAKVQTRGVPMTAKHLTKEEREFWDPPVDQFKLGQCDTCKTCQVDGRVPRFFWSPHYDQNGTVMCRCAKCGTETMIARRL